MKYDRNYFWLEKYRFLIKIKNSCLENIHKLFFQSLVLYILALLISRSDKKTICIFCVSSHIFCQTSSNNSPNILIFPFHIIFRSHSNVKRVGRFLNRRTQFYLLNFYFGQQTLWHQSSPDSTNSEAFCNFMV